MGCLGRAAGYLRINFYQKKAFCPVFGVDFYGGGCIVINYEHGVSMRQSCIAKEVRFESSTLPKL
jgi:hypothetical protein